MNKRTKQTQWDYPDDDDDDEEEEPSRDSSPDQEQAPIKQEPVEDKSMETEAVTSTTPEQEEITATNEDVSSTQVSKEDQKPTQHADGWPDYEAVTNYISGTEYSGVIRGEPPPPGTDLEFLLTAPPPPPPPEEETDKGYSYDVPGPPENQGTDDMDMDNVDGVAMEEEESTPIQSSDITGDQYSESHTSDPSVITGAPQMFTDMSYPSYYEGEADTGGQYQDMGQYYSESDNPNSVETSRIGDASLSQQEKRKKKKDKQSSGQLKNKGMSNLVQKWQKVKKEVEIEEQAREEKQQAIRQKLNEWKKEYS